MSFWLLFLACDPAAITLSTPKAHGPSDLDTTPSNTDDTGTNGTNHGTEADPPVAVVQVASDARVGETIVFDGSASSDPAGKPLSYDWVCNDGSTGSDATISVVAQMAGTLHCSLTVHATSGKEDTAEGNVVVADQVMADWTVLVFINGDNDLEPYALMDLNEIEGAGSTDQVNLLVQLDRARGYDDSDGDWTGSRRYRAEADGGRRGIQSPVLEDIGEVNSGDPQTVVDFVRWGVENYPAQHYALVLWDHGDGWYLQAPLPRKGVSWDETSRQELSIAGGDFETLLGDSVALIGQPFDLVGIDACLMSTWEVAYAAMPYSKAFVGSQDYEGAYGWSYTNAFTPLVQDPTLDGGEVGAWVASTFYDSGDSTQSVTDLEALPELTAALDDVADALMASNNGQELWYTAVDDSFSFDRVNYDLGGILSSLAGSDDRNVASAANIALGAYDGTVLSNWTRSREATGLSIYAPTRGVDRSYAQGSWTRGSHWDEMIAQMVN